MTLLVLQCEFHLYGLVRVGKGATVPAHIRTRHVEKVDVNPVGRYADGRRHGRRNGPVALDANTANTIQTGQCGRLRRAAKQYIGIIRDRNSCRKKQTNNKQTTNRWVKVCVSKTFELTNILFWFARVLGDGLGQFCVV
jgi:hypothetical protein